MFSQPLKRFYYIKVNSARKRDSDQYDRMKVHETFLAGEYIVFRQLSYSWAVTVDKKNSGKDVKKYT